MASDRLTDAGAGRNGPHALMGMLRQAAFGRLATIAPPTARSLGDAEADGPIMADVLAYFGRGPFFRAAFRNSSSSA